MTDPKISLIISVYKNLESLSIILEALKYQSFKSFEVIIAEDDNSIDTKSLLKEKSVKYPFEIKHVFHEDKGFRKNKILNDAIKVASGEFCTFIDGDCLPHKHFLKNIYKHIKPNTALGGRRVLITKKITEAIYKKKIFKGYLPLYQLLKCKHFEVGLYLPFIPIRQRSNRTMIGCNMTIPKLNLNSINGFDENYTTPTYGEDTDLDYRLRKAGCKIYFTKFQAIVYHLYHQKFYNTNDINKSKELFYAKINQIV